MNTPNDERGDERGDERVLVGRVIKPHGIRGELVVDLRSDLDDRIAPGDVLDGVLGGRSSPMTVTRTRPHQGRLLVTFEGVPDRTAAEQLRRMELFAAAVDLSDADHYFIHELIGLEVRGEDGRDLGRVGELIELPEAAGYDLLEIIRSDGTTWLLPAVGDFVEVVEDADGAQRLQLTDPPEGLLELGSSTPDDSVDNQDDDSVDNQDDDSVDNQDDDSVDNQDDAPVDDRPDEQEAP